MDNAKILKDVSEIIKKAGETVLFYYNKNYDIKDKGGDSPVTEADIVSNDIILAGLKKYDYGILSEESAFDNSRLRKKRVWVIDPLDGTKDFISKTGEFTIMIGLVEAGDSIFGMVYQPLANRLYYAFRGQGAFLQENDELVRLRVSDMKLGREIRIVSSRFHRSDLEIELAKKLNTKKIITCGSAGLKICRIAEGKVDLNINPSDKMGEWDVCAADIILHEAGGKLTSVSGEKIVYNKKEPRIKNGYMASNGLIHNSVIKKIDKWK